MVTAPGPARGSNLYFLTLFYNKKAALSTVSYEIVYPPASGIPVSRPKGIAAARVTCYNRSGNEKVILERTEGVFTLRRKKERKNETFYRNTAFG